MAFLQHCLPYFIYVNFNRGLSHEKPARQLLILPVCIDLLIKVGKLPHERLEKNIIFTRRSGGREEEDVHVWRSRCPGI
jgi:hypothetical protein